MGVYSGSLGIGQGLGQSPFTAAEPTQSIDQLWSNLNNQRATYSYPIQLTSEEEAQGRQFF